jgi:hypothetical protein
MCTLFVQQNNIEEGTNRGLWNDFGLAKFYYIVKKSFRKTWKNLFFESEMFFSCKN